MDESIHTQVLKSNLNFWEFQINSTKVIREKNMSLQKLQRERESKGRERRNKERDLKLGIKCGFQLLKHSAVQN